MALKEVWPGYETVERIGRGGYGTVYKVKKTDPTGEYYSAVKKISIPKDEDEYYSLKDEDYSDENITAIFEQRMQRIVDEFKLMAKFKGMSHIVSYEDHMIVEHENGIGWDILIRMELLSNLKKHFKNMNENDVIKLGIDMCKALEVIQKENIVHRDIKPENILVNDYGQYKLSDFGIAKTMDHVTKATLIGTPDYIAPEVFHKQAYGFLADEYSLGLVLYWALNERRMPFVEIKDKPPTDEEIQSAQKRRMDGEALPEPLHGNTLLKRAVLKACSYKPENRFQTITEFKRALQLCEGDFDMPEEDKPTEEIEETTEDFTSSETVGVWGQSQFMDEEPAEAPKEEEVDNKYHRLLEMLKHSGIAYTQNRFDEISIQKEMMQEVSAYDAFLIGLAYTFGAKVTVTDKDIQEAIGHDRNGWMVTFHETGSEEYCNLSKNEELAKIWLEYAAENGEYRAMALLSYISEYDQNDLQNAQYWMNKAYYLPSSEYKDFLKQETERQNKKANPEVVDKTAILNRFLPGMQGKYCIKPDMDNKLLDQAVKIMRLNPSYLKYGGEEDLKNQEIIGIYISKTNVFVPAIISRQVIIFTREKLFSNLLFSRTVTTVSQKTILGEMKTSKPQNSYSYCVTYRSMLQFENTDFDIPYPFGKGHYRDQAIHMIYTPDTNYPIGYLAYYHKQIDGNILLYLLKELSKTEKKDAMNTSLRTQSFLQETKDLKVSEQVITDFFNNFQGDIFKDIFTKK